MHKLYAGQVCRFFNKFSNGYRINPRTNHPVDTIISIIVRVANNDHLTQGHYPYSIDCTVMVQETMIEVIGPERFNVGCVVTLGSQLLSPLEDYEPNSFLKELLAKNTAKG